MAKGTKTTNIVIIYWSTVIYEPFIIRYILCRVASYMSKIVELEEIYRLAHQKLRVYCLISQRKSYFVNSVSLNGSKATMGYYKKWSKE